MRGCGAGALVRGKPAQKGDSLRAVVRIRTLTRGGKPPDRRLFGSPSVFLRQLFQFFSPSAWPVTLARHSGHRAGRKAPTGPTLGCGHFGCGPRVNKVDYRTSKIAQVVVAWAYSFPSTSTIRASEVPTWRPTCRAVPTQRSGPVFVWAARTMFRLIWLVV